MAWAVETLNATVDKELEALPADMRARFVRISNLIAHKRERGSNVELLHKKWFSDPEYRTAYDKLGPEFEIARAVILARKGAGLTQQQLAQRMNTTQSGSCSRSSIPARTWKIPPTTPCTSSCGARRRTAHGGPLRRVRHRRPHRPRQVTRVDRPDRA